MSGRLSSSKVIKDIKYLNKDFGGFRQDLVNFTKNYFPETYNDFNESSPGMMFMELAAATGDALSFYTDIQLRESILETVEEDINLYNIAHSLGYKPKFKTPSSVDLDVYQILPSINSGVDTVPDYRYALQVEGNTTVSTQNSIQFRTLTNVDFRYSSSLNPTEVTVYSIDDVGEIEYFLLKKSVKAVSGTIRTATYAFTDPKPYDKITISDLDVLEIIDIYDSDGNQWYETPYLAQDLVAIAVPNLPYNDSYLSTYRVTAPYLLQYRQTEKRFVTRLRADRRTEIQFGAGISSELDEEIVPNPFNVGFGLDYFERVVDLSIDPKNFLYTKTYGKAPSDTTLTVRYTVGNGIPDNVQANTISVIDSARISTSETIVDSGVYNTVVASLAVNNPHPACGALVKKNIESVRREAIANFASQNRTVTKDDYIVRAYSMPVQYGTIAKAYVELDDQIVDYNIDTTKLNPFGLNLYVLGYDGNGNFSNINDAIKYNLINYFKEYRMLTDSVNIKNAFIVNIGMDFEIVVEERYNSNEVLLVCIDMLKKYFDNDKMEINKPIFKNTVMKEIAQVRGVLSVTDLKIFNLYDSTLGYSSNIYNIDAATKRNIIYSSLDPCIFEVKYPNKDIRGRVVNY